MKRIPGTTTAARTLLNTQAEQKSMRMNTPLGGHSRSVLLAAALLTAHYTGAKLELKEKEAAAPREEKKDHHTKHQAIKELKKFPVSEHR